MNFILQISSKCGQGGEGKKSENFAAVIDGSSQKELDPRFSLKLTEVLIDPALLPRAFISRH